jgi:hypothetical protein
LDASLSVERIESGLHGLLELAGMGATHGMVGTQKARDGGGPLKG